jgi:hypothetical protein
LLEQFRCAMFLIIQSGLDIIIFIRLGSFRWLSLG